MLFPCTRGRKSSREKILDAAAELVAEIGAGRLTLDAVAEKAGLSKGGLLYNFPTKEALLQGMIQRMIDQVTSEKDALRETVEPGPNLEARVVTKTLLNICCGGKMQEFATGMMAATAENPGLLDPVRQVIGNTLKQLKASSDDLDAALVGWLATEGLSNLEMHNLSPFTDEDRDRIVKAIDRVVVKGIAE
ncbi:TetR/AcrR family transcriptional regulator [Microvirga mediterraneensis]|uniref:TetR/AcrR family transcriptional regulator n=1 Tax=Microvirga mediterraneensis TaxID=2754695 RepID=A0A838BKB4_9HYPH|nr:TetR/AcrR family transcriptional regulator [Microvirga mediterraneensis]MBA1155595.1 TetR/AcrR family transcriptional regulator [Microvirga mediterraneensis]